MLALNQLGDGFTGNAHSFFEIHSSPPGNAHIDGSDTGVEIHFRLRSRRVLGQRRCRSQDEGQRKDWKCQEWQDQQRGHKASGQAAQQGDHKIRF